MTGSPRDIAKSVNESSKFDSAAQNYDAEAGCPHNVAGSGKEREYRANPTNPAEDATPAKGLKR